MRGGVDCTVWLDGERLADGSPTDNPGDPAVLSGLAITWGRDSTVDQPEASTCTFTLSDDPSDSSFHDRIHTRSRIDVTASGALYTDPDTPTIPPLEDTPVGQTPSTCGV